jgi:hypothetical protein
MMGSTLSAVARVIAGTMVCLVIVLNKYQSNLTQKLVKTARIFQNEESPNMAYPRRVDAQSTTTGLPKGE